MNSKKNKKKSAQDILTGFFFVSHNKMLWPSFERLVRFRSATFVDDSIQCPVCLDYFNDEKCNSIPVCPPNISSSECETWVKENTMFTKENSSEWPIANRKETCSIQDKVTLKACNSF